jgi:predicted 2-oxoglutarate/Fe(II)-dependent dioxygenase YbiX
MPEEFIASVVERISPLIPQIASHYGENLGGCAEPQFLMYGPGDHFFAHADVHDDYLLPSSLRRRRISVLIFLSGWCADDALCVDDEHYCGGLLNFHRSSEPRGIWSLASEPGLLVAFQAAVTHEVTPITAGQRFSIVTWLLGPEVPATRSPRGDPVCS